MNRFIPGNFTPWQVQSRGYTKPIRPVLNPTHPMSADLILCCPLGTTGFQSGGAQSQQPRNINIAPGWSDAIMFNFPTNPWVASHHGGQTLTFDGVDDYVGFGAVATFSKTTPFSGCAWVKTSSAGIQQIHGNWQISVNPGWEFSINQFTAHTLSLHFTDAVGSNYFGRRGATTVNDGNWHFVAYTYDGSGANTGINLYVDGQLETMTNLSLGTGNPGTLASVDFRIGRRSSTGIPFSGPMDMHRVYGNRILTQAEIIWLYGEPYSGILSYPLTPIGTVRSSETSTGELDFSGISFTGIASALTTSSGLLTFPGISFTGSGTLIETASGLMAFPGISFTSTGFIGEIGTGTLTFTGISMSGNVLIPGSPGTGLRLFWNF